MWEQIRSNQRKSAGLVVVLAGLLFVLGYVGGEALQPGAGLFGLGLAFVLWIILSLISYFSGGQILLGALTLGGLVAFIQYSEKFFRPISDLSEKFNILQGAMASSERIFGLLDTENAIRTPDEPVTPQHRDGSARFENVSFAYDGDDWVLRDVDLDVRPGEMVAVQVMVSQPAKPPASKERVNWPLVR